MTARELSLEEIKKIYDATHMEIESFVHGALCYCYSGQCLMSSMIGGRSETGEDVHSLAVCLIRFTGRKTPE